MLDPAFIVSAVYAAMGVTGVSAALRERWRSKDARLRRALARTKMTSIAGASGTTARIAGRIGAPQQPLIAPFSGRPCVFCSVVVKRYELSLIRCTDSADFLVRDSTGKALVRVDTRTVVVAQAARLVSGPFVPALLREPRVADLLRRHPGSVTEHYDGRGPMVFREVSLGEGDSVSVSGPAEWMLDPEPDDAVSVGYREPPKRLELSSKGAVVVTIGDAPAPV